MARPWRRATARRYHTRVTRARGIQSFDRVAHLYDATRSRDGGPDSAVAAGLAGIFGAGHPPPRVLEVGVGTGRLAVPLAAHGVRVLGLDVSRAMLTVMRKAGTPDGVMAEAARLPVRPASCDGALFVHILHLVPDPGAAVRAALAAVRPGGVLVDGRTTHTHILPDPRELLRQAAESLGAVHTTTAPRQAAASRVFRDILTAAGATLETAVLAEWTEHTTGHAYLAEVRGRVRSNMWDIPEELVPAIVDRLAPMLERAWGSLDTPAETRAAFLATAARLPAGRS